MRSVTRCDRSLSVYGPARRYTFSYSRTISMQKAKLPVKRVSKAQQRQFHQLLMRFCAARNVAPSALVCPEFTDCVSFLSDGRHTNVTRYHLMLALQDLCSRIDSKKRSILSDSSFIGFSADSWTKASRHLAAMTAGNPGTTFYLSSYENLSSDNAAAGADAIQKCMLGALELPLDLDSKHPSYPRAKVSVFTSDTTIVMPATNRELRRYPLFEGCVWVPCFPHVGNLFLIDQLKIASIANLLSHAKQIALNFRTGAFRKIFLMCTNTILHVACSQ